MSLGPGSASEDLRYLDCAETFVVVARLIDAIALQTTPDTSNVYRRTFPCRVTKER
ncbi:MAG: hypothetical protein AAFR58_13895 [Cyanobacteria bacterium J06627_28]